jgi:hypothetical protein
VPLAPPQSLGRTRLRAVGSSVHRAPEHHARHEQRLVFTRKIGARAFSRAPRCFPHFRLDDVAPNEWVLGRLGLRFEHG